MSTGTPTRPRAQIVRSAVTDDIAEARMPLTMLDMRRARAAAANLQELHVVLVRMVKHGELTRSGAGYHNGEPFRYWLASLPAPKRQP
jgi:hypothetical protein